MARKRIKKAECPNCNYQFSEINNYCPNCGQENHTHKLPIKHFLVEVLESTLHFDTKVFVTIRDLFIPGKITSQYNQNKRGRYVPPVRLYIFISFIFFLLLSFQSPSKEDNNKKSRKETKKEKVYNKVDLKLNEDSVESKRDTVGKYLLEQIKVSPHPDELIDSYLQLKYKDRKWYNQNIYRNIVKYRTGHFDKEELTHRLYKSISYSMFILMPIFAFYLYLLYWRKRLFYSEHLIFSIHFHSLAFLLLSIWLLLSLFHVNAGVYIVLIILAYFLLLLRKVYAQRWLKTIMKFLFLGFIYTVSIFVVLLLGVVLSVLV